MRSWRTGVLTIALAAAGCGSPTSPTDITPPGGTRPKATWNGTLSRAGASATVTMTLDEFSAADPNRMLLGAFTAQYPVVSYEGSAGALVDQNQWAITLVPSIPRSCAVPIMIASGTTVLNVAVVGGRMTGEAILVECEGRSTWTAAFTRR